MTIEKRFPIGWSADIISEWVHERIKHTSLLGCHKGTIQVLCDGDASPLAEFDMLLASQVADELCEMIKKQNCAYEISVVVELADAHCPPEPKKKYPSHSR